RRETGHAYLGAHSPYRPHIDLPVVCSIHARSMSVREEPWLPMAPPSSFLQQQLPFNISIQFKQM
ncbi:unnamed protein product, partial [Rotaria socialis]